jgi:hypothetical protein
VVRAKIDVFLGDACSIDFSFLEKRKKWLSSTGVYVEFDVHGKYDQPLTFLVESLDSEKISVCRYSWNKFFLNLNASSQVLFRVKEGDVVKVERLLDFDVVKIEAQLVFSVPNLLDYGVSDIRFFCNRLSEKLVNGTRIVLFSQGMLQRFAGVDWNAEEEGMLGFFDMVFSIVTERGLCLYVTPFDEHAVYTEEIIGYLKKILFKFIERYSKLKIVWDFSSGLPNRFINVIFDGVLDRFQSLNVEMILPAILKNKNSDKFGMHLQREFVPVLDEIKESNESGKRLLCITMPDVDTEQLRLFVASAVKNNYGVELVLDGNADIRQVKYYYAWFMHLGYERACREKCVE